MLELSISVSVMLIAVMTALSSQLVALDLAKALREENAAMSDLRSAMDAIQLLPPDAIPIASSAFADGQPIAAFTNRNLANEAIVPDYPGFAGATVPDPLAIVLTCTWTDWKGRPRSLTLRSAVTR